MRFKNFFLTLSLLAAFLTVNVLSAQNDNAQRPSPAMTATKKIGDLAITINYSSPAVKGRKVFGGLEAYGKVWRTGANEATTFEVNKNVTLDGQKLPAGKYALFTIPGEKEWVLIINKEANQWGAYNYKKEQDILRINTKPGKNKENEERLKFDISDKGVVTFAWELANFAFAVKEDK
jgi:hypothetical protein